MLNIIKVVFICAVIVSVCLFSTNLLSADMTIKINGRYLIKGYESLHEATVIESTKEGKYVRVRHDYQLGNPTII